MTVAFRLIPVRPSRVVQSLLVLASCCVSFGAANLVPDSGFETQTTNTVSAPWLVEGPDAHGIDRGRGFSHSGANNAWIRNSTTNWNAITQSVPVTPNTNYTLSAWVQNNFARNSGSLGVRAANGTAALAEASFYAFPTYAQVMVNFNSGPNSTVKVYVGFRGQGTDYWLRIDDISIQPTVIASQSTFFSTVAEEGYATYQMPGDGDLWPSCWADDGNLYTANGDGTAFNDIVSHDVAARYDMAVSRISGEPPSLTGTTVATSVGTNWSGANYNRKPTGMACVGGAIYLAFQNLNLHDFNDVPAASIAKSADHGKTWTWDASAPMFGTPGMVSPTAYRFTTIFFADFGMNSANAIDGYVYAYGMDNNWREQTSLFLARVPADSIQKRSAWTFFTGTEGDGSPRWSSDITMKAPVLEDDRLVSPVMFGTGCPSNDRVIGQGGVVYDAPLQRYIFSSWSCATHELYEAPHPWGPWSLFYSKGFTPMHLAHSRGQYGTNIPSKFISADGKSLWLQSNVCCSGNSYDFALRQVHVEPASPSAPSNAASETANLAGLLYAPQPISKSSHFGLISGPGFSSSLNDGILKQSEDDFDEETKPASWWGYTWPASYNMNKVVYVTGSMSPDGGWYSCCLNVQVRQNFQWVDVSDLKITPSYPYNNSAGPYQTYVFTFQDTWGDGVRVIGTPGGTSHFTSIGELAVYYDTNPLLADPGFEFQTGSALSGAWTVEGPDDHTIEHDTGISHTGSGDARIGSSKGNWNALTQTVQVRPNTNYSLSAWIWNNFKSDLGFFGVRKPDGVTVLKETALGPSPWYMQWAVTFNSGSNTSVQVFAGFRGQSSDQWLRMDDISLRECDTGSGRRDPVRKGCPGTDATVR
jgi:hypothetical protein